MATFKFGVFVPPQGSPAAAAVDALSDATGLSRVDCRMLLRSRVPRRVASARTKADARDRVLTLRGAGFDAFVVSFEALTRKTARRVRSCRFEGDDIVFGKSVRLRPGELHLILLGAFERGRLSVEREYRPVPTGIGYIPYMSHETRRRRSTETELFLHLYGDTHRKVIEIRSRSFDFSCLGKDKGYAGAVNLRKFCRRLRGLNPDARFDDRLMKFSLPMSDVGGRTRFGGFPGTVQMTRSRTLSNEDGVLAGSRLLAIHALGR